MHVGTGWKACADVGFFEPDYLGGSEEKNFSRGFPAHGKRQTCSLLGLHQAQNILVEDQNHQSQEQHQAQSLGHLPVLQRHRLAPDRL